MSIYPNSKTTICCDNLQTKLQQAGVMESRITRNNKVQEYINLKACNPEKSNADDKTELYPVEFDDGGDKMIAKASNGRSAWNVAEYASSALKDDVLRCFEQRDNAFRNVYDDKYLKNGEAVTPDGKPFGNAVSGVHPKFIKPMKNNPDKSVFVIPLGDNEDIWDTYADKTGRKNNNKNISLPNDSNVTLYNPKTKEKTNVASIEVVQMFNKSREDYLNNLMAKQNQLKYPQQNMSLPFDNMAENSESEIEF